MTYDEFIALVTSEAPSLEDYKRVVAFVESASIDTLWKALTSGRVHRIFVAVINKALQEKIVQENLEASMRNVARSSKLPGLGQ